MGGAGRRSFAAMDEPMPELPGASTDRPIADRIRAAMLMVLIAVGIGLCFLLAALFLGAITWALTLAVLTLLLVQIWRARDAGNRSRPELGRNAQDAIIE